MTGRVLVINCNVRGSLETFWLGCQMRFLYWNRVKFLTIIVSSLICQNKRNQPREQISSFAAEVWCFSPKGYPLKAGKYIYVFFLLLLWWNRLIFPAFKHISCERQRWRLQRGLTTHTINTPFLLKLTSPEPNAQGSVHPPSTCQARRGSLMSPHDSFDWQFDRESHSRWPGV